jgi:sucrose phosphorylase
MVYNFALPPLVLHAFLTGSAKVLCEWAATLVPPSDATAFFNFLDSHDGVGLMGARGILGEDQIHWMCERVRANGGFVSMKSDGDGAESPYELNITWFSALNPDDGNDPVDLQVDRFIASRAVALVLRGVPGIYLPSMFGSRNDVEAVYRDGVQRSINRSAIQERRLFEAFGDPASVPARIATRYIDLLEARVATPAFHPAAEQRVLDVDHRVLAVLRTSADFTSCVLSLINVSSEDVAVTLDLAALGLDGPLADLVSEDELEVEHGRIQLAPYQVSWLVCR